MLDIHVSVEGDRLRCSAPAGRLTQELERRIAYHKLELIESLRSARNSSSIRGQSTPGARLPLSFAQERFWFAHNLNPESATYNITALRHLQNPVDADVLERALHLLVRRHETLRTRFLEENGVPAQEVLDDGASSLEIHDLAQLNADDRSKAFDTTVTEFGSRPFDFERGYLCRVALIHLSRQNCCVVLAAHHIICDGWSLGIFFRELRSIYEGLIAGDGKALDDLQVQYSDYVSWERSRLSSSALASQLEYWKGKLSGAPSAIEIPIDQPRGVLSDYKPRRCAFQLSAATSESLRRLARESAATPFMVLLAVFKTLLSRYSSQNSIVVGTPVSTRTTSSLEGLIGCFINMHPLLTEISDEISTQELVDRVKVTVINSLTHTDVPFELLVRQLLPKRDLSRPPLFQHAFILLNTPDAQEYEVVSGGSDLEMTLYMWESEGKFHGSFEYDGAIFDPAMVSCLAGCFQTLADGMASRPNVPLAQLDLVNSNQARDWFDRHNGPSTELPFGCTHEWVESQARETPERIAVVCGRERISFRDLCTRSRRLAHRLQTLGIKPRSLVALCLNRTVDMVVAPLAVWQAGAAYVPLDPDFPPERLAFMLADAGASVLVTESDLLARLPSSLPLTICLDDELGKQAKLVPCSALESAADDLAYVMYTSGSHGNPKGTEICHRSLVNLLASMQQEPGIGPTDHLLAVTTLSFDISVLELFLPLVGGAQLIIAPSSAVADGAALARLIDQFDITMMQATPVTWRLLLESGWKGKSGLKILCGGEALPRDLAIRLVQTGAKLWNLYGPTETTIWSTVHRITPPVERIAIGHPIANTDIQVLDEKGRPVPPGMAGELLIGGAGLARGYRNQASLTSERFVTTHGTRLYRTGDKVRRLANGSLEYIARMDQQVKIRGVRIELGEVEAAMERHPDVAQAVVTLREDASGDKRLVAHWRARDNVGTDALELRKSLRRLLPETMIPAEYIRVEDFPLTPNRKLDRKALVSAEFRPSLERGDALRQESLDQLRTEEDPDRYCAPSNYVEAVLEEIWREVLQIQEIDVYDNFFELGGHSLLATRVISRIRAALDMDLPLRSIFVDPTIRALANHMSFEPSSRRYSYANDLPPWKRLVPVQPRGHRIPLFFLAGYHAPDGPLLFLSHLIPYLGQDQPVFGFRPRWMDGDGEAYATVEEVARDYLSELRQVQPSGPYLLGGNCVEGIAVLEIARLLEQEGEEVKLVVLLDTEKPSARRIMRRDFSSYRDRLRHFGEVIYAIANAKGGERVQAIRDLAARKIGTASSPEVRETDRFHQRRASYSRLLYRHIPSPWTGRITLIGNQNDLEWDRDLGWTGFSREGLDIHVIPGSHDTMLTMHGKEVAVIVRRSIDEALGNRFVEQECSEVGI